MISDKTRYFLITQEWRAKLETLNVQLMDLPELVRGHVDRETSQHPTNASVTLVDSIPTVRLANACEATANGLYSLAEIAANFGNKSSKGMLPSSFNALRKKCECDPTSEIAMALGDLQWFRKVREIRTEWAHYSSVFIGGGTRAAPILCIRRFRRPSDQVEFKEEMLHCSVDDLVCWVRSAMTTLDRFAEFLLVRHVLPSLQLDLIVDTVVLDKTGFPVIREGGLLVPERISIREYLRRGGMNIPITPESP